MPTVNTRLGINFAWYDYGADFAPERLGRGRPDWRLKVSKPQPGLTPAYGVDAISSAASVVQTAFGDPSAYASDTDDPNTTKLYADLQFLKTIGVSCVRWYLLGDGGIFTKDDVTDSPLKVPAAMPDAWTKDFHYALRVFNAARIKMIPVLIDFTLASKPKVIFNGREYPVPFKYFRGGNSGAVDADLIKKFIACLQAQLGPSIPSRSADPATYLKGGRSDWLVDSDLQPKFLSLLTQIINLDDDLANAVYAWEIMSEPDMCCTDYNSTDGDVYFLGYTPGDGYNKPPVTRKTGGITAGYEPTALDGFLVTALMQFSKNQKRQVFTIGFNSAHTLIARLNGANKVNNGVYQGLMREGKFLPNFHYYPENLGWVSSRTETNLIGAPAKGTSHRQQKLSDLAQLLKEPVRGARELLIGEIATSNDYQGLENATWPDDIVSPDEAKKNAQSGNLEHAKWGGASLGTRLGLIDDQFSKLGVPVTVLPWAFISGGERVGFTLRHAAAMANFAGNKTVAADLSDIAPDGADP